LMTYHEVHFNLATIITQVTLIEERVSPNPSVSPPNKRAGQSEMFPDII
jgi:hypothetical protein